MKDFTEFQEYLYTSGKMDEFLSSHLCPDDSETETTLDLSSPDGIAHLMGISQAAMISVFMDCLSAYHEWLSEQLDK